MSRTIEDLADHFDAIDVAPPDWPIRCSLFVPNARALREWPDYPQAARPQAGRAGNGRGWTAQACLASGLGEAVQLASTCAWGDEPLRRASCRAMVGGSDRWLGPGAIMGFSRRQIARRDRWNCALDGTDWIPPPVPADREIAWLAGRDAATGERVWLCADAVLIGRREIGDPQAPAWADSNGCAAGISAADAQLRAVLELVERDATGRWWYGTRTCPRLEPASHGRARAVAAHLAARQRRLALYEITADLGLPVAAAAGCARDGGEVALGFGAALSLADAVDQALCELLQMELLVAAAGAAEPPAHLCRWLAEATAATPPLCRSAGPMRPVPAAAAPPRPAEAALAQCLDCCRTAGVRIALIDCTRPAFDVPVWRAVSAELNHFRPRLGRGRPLYPAAGQCRGPADLRNPTILRL